MNGIPSMYGQPGTFGQPGMYGQPGMGSMNPNTGSSKKDAAKFQPSKPLRELITDRLLEQHVLLRKAELRIENLVGISNQGKLVGKDRLGDQHIAADKVDEIIAKGMASTAPSQGAPGMLGLGLGGFDPLRGPRGSRPRGRDHKLWGLHEWDDDALAYSSHPALDAPRMFAQIGGQLELQKTMKAHGDAKKMAKKMEKVDPMLMYNILDDEIQALLTHAGSGPYELSSPVAKDAALKHVLGAGKGDLATAMMKVAAVDSDDSEEDDGEDSGGQAAATGPPMAPMMNQGQQGYMPQMQGQGQIQPPYAQQQQYPPQGNI